MTGRKLFDLYRDNHGGETGVRPGEYDDLSPSQRLVWERLADDVAIEIESELRQRGVIA